MPTFHQRRLRSIDGAYVPSTMPTFHQRCLRSINGAYDPSTMPTFHQRCLRSINDTYVPSTVPTFHHGHQDYVTNNDVLERANLPKMEAMLLSKQLRWAGHVSRMEDSRMPKVVFYGESVRARVVEEPPGNTSKTN